MKYITPTLKKIDNIQSTKFGSIDIPKLKIQKHLGWINKKDDKYYVDILTTRSMRKLFKQSITIYALCSNDSYILNNSFFVTEGIDERTWRLKYTLQSSNVITGSVDGNMYYRKVVKISKRISFTDLFPTYGFKYEGMSSSGLLKIQTKRHNYEIFVISEKGYSYIFIDCINITNKTTFTDEVFSILLAIGFLMGEYCQGESFTCCSSDSNFQNIAGCEYVTLRSSISTPFTILEGNPYNIFPLETAEQHREKMSKISQDVVNTLIQNCLDSTNIQNSLLLILEASNYPLDSSPACLSVSLESICNVIMIENEDRVNPIKDKKLARKIRDELFDIIKKYESEISDPSSIEILKRKIESLNSPTNRDKLTKPFEILGLPLKKYEIEAIENRNNFLHSNGSIKLTRDIKNADSEFHKVYFTYFVLIRLLYSLILKRVGYNGYIVNILKNQEDIIGVMHDEDLMIKI